MDYGESDGSYEMLLNSIIANGVQEPVRVRKVDDTYVLVDGHRRLKATMEAIGKGHEIVAIPAILEKRNISEMEALINSATANTGKGFTPMEEAVLFSRLEKYGMTVEQIASRMGTSVSTIHNRLLLTNATPAVQEAVQKKQVGVVAAQNIVKASQGSMEKQNAMLAQEKAKKVGGKRKTPSKPKMPKKVEAIQKDLEAQLDQLSESLGIENPADEKGATEYERFLFINGQLQMLKQLYG